MWATDETGRATGCDIAFYVAGATFLLLALVSPLLALLVFRHGPGRALNRSLAALLFLWGVYGMGSAANALLRVGRAPGNSLWTYPAAMHAVYLASFAALAFALVWARPGRRSALAAAAVGLLGLTAMVTRIIVPDDAAIVHLLLRLLPDVAIFAAPVVLLLTLADRTAERTNTIALAAAVALPLVYIGVRDLPILPIYVFHPDFARTPLALAPTVVDVALGLALVAGLVFFMRRYAADTPRAVAWLVALAAGSALLDTLNIYAYAGLIDLPPLGDYEISLVPFAAWMTIANLYLAYLVLRGRVAGVEVQFRVGVSRSALAGIFLAVFFVASEAAQEFFGQETGNQYFGIAAAGLLVFALTPLSRLADRLAQQTIPLPAGQDAQETYRTLYRKFAKDGDLSPADERALARAATALRLRPDEVYQVRSTIDTG